MVDLFEDLIHISQQTPAYFAFEQILKASIKISEKPVTIEPSFLWPFFSFKIG